MNDKPIGAEFASTVTVSGTTCPSCSGTDTRVFYEVDNIPVHQVRLVRSKEAALNCPKGDMRMALCHDCGFVWNAAFKPELVTYEDDYESTQAVSPAFNVFHQKLAENLMQRYDLAGKEVFEIGCGQGEFLAMLCDLGAASATGFDPVIRELEAEHPKVKLLKEWYDEKYADLRPDFVCSKMVMEHIPDPGRYCAMLRATIGDRPEVISFAMMPEVTRILKLRAFWDIYYEHCAYFSLGSLGRAFRHAGFDVVDLWTDFADQYALIGARPTTGESVPLDVEETPEELAALVDAFAARVKDDREKWRGWIDRKLNDGKKVALWGGGSKAVAFLTTLGIEDGIELAIDINPMRNGTYIAGTGQKIATPDALEDYKPDIVVVMSPFYRDEIQADLESRGLSPELVMVETPPEG
jgi:SAM-dependent methyltransferase